MDFGGERASGEFSVDLKLGRVGNLGEDSKTPKMVSSPSGSSKRARGGGGNNGSAQKVSCLVDGCNADLSKCREYHRRHKVCEVHSKTPQVTIAGQKRRFCQQCSRFHSLEEFDEVKRSCRKRLDGHNRRRRRPQTESLSRSGNLFSNYQGARVLPFSTTQIYSNTAMVNSTWSGVIKMEEDVSAYNQPTALHLLDKQNSFLGSFSSSHKGGKQLSFFQGINTSSLHNQGDSQVSMSQPFLKSISSTERGEGSRKMFCDGLANQVLDSDCALSLLSSPPTQTPGIGLNHLVHTSSAHLNQQTLGPGLHFSSTLETMDSVLAPNASESDVHCHGMFSMRPDISSGNEAPQTLPFYWD
ncbi:SBP domain [Dillenia turbinata]|uniref:SBP domain n=1 Tax=Dillenia turbinata TaxID=194707 RepID=A0AAN8V3Y0_9MAGN